MALLNLDKIILYRTVLGPKCPVCTGELSELSPSNTTHHPPWWAFWKRGGNEAVSYSCKSCGKQYLLTEKEMSS